MNYTFNCIMFKGQKCCKFSHNISKHILMDIVLHWDSPKMEHKSRMNNKWWPFASYLYSVGQVTWHGRCDLLLLRLHFLNLYFFSGFLNILNSLYYYMASVFGLQSAIEAPSGVVSMRNLIGGKVRGLSTGKLHFKEGKMTIKLVITTLIYPSCEC